MLPTDFGVGVLNFDGVSGLMRLEKYFWLLLFPVVNHTSIWKLLNENTLDDAACCYHTTLLTLVLYIVGKMVCLLF